MALALCLWAAAGAAQAQLEPALTKADAAFATHDYAGAAYWYGRAAEADPHNARALVRGGISLQRAGYNDKAIPRLDAALAQSPNDVDARYARAMAHVALQQYAPAQADLEAVVSARPRSASAQGWLGLVRALQGDDQGALKAYDRALKLKPGDTRIRLNRAASRYTLRRYRQAIADLDAVIRRDPRNAAAYNDRALAHARLGQTKAARRDFARAARLASPQRVTAADGRLPERAAVLYNQALLDWSAKRPQAALALLDKAAQVAPASPMVAYLRGLLHFQQQRYKRVTADVAPALGSDRPLQVPLLVLSAKAHLNRREDAPAAQALERVVSLDRLHPEANRLLGDAHYNLGQLRMAAQDYARQLALFPDDREALRHRADALYFQGAFKDAVADLDRLIALVPKDGPAHTRRGDAHYRLGQYPAAIADYRAAQAHGQSGVELLAHLAEAEAREGQNQAALATYGRALALVPGRAGLLVERGHVRFAEGDFPGALADYTQASGKAPKRADVHVYIAETEARLGHPDRAIESYTRALALNPSLAGAYLNRGILLQRAGRKGEACADWHKACLLGEQKACAYLKTDC
ncbi:MAG TPA: tetratricopeptide repeat protein [bacterium]|nr:tetratricopeptide repeat protein [bacterium]